jgi:voltage-gated potassium channel
MRKAFKLILGISLLVVSYSLVFMALMSYEGQVQNVDLLDAFYWVVITITTLGYGDIVFHSHLGRLFSIVVAISGVALLWAVVMPLMITPRLEDLLRAAPSSAPQNMQGHIIISGYSPMIETLTKKLSLLKIPFMIIERSEEIAKSIYKTYPTLWGDPSERKVMMKANVHSAKLFITNESDELDAEVILSLREISDIKIIELVNDLASSRFLCYAGATRIISPKTLLGTFIAQIVFPPKNKSVPGAAFLFGNLMIAELPIYPGSRLITNNQTLDAIKLSGANIVGVWQKGKFRPVQGKNEPFQSNSVIMAVGNSEQLSQIRNLAFGVRKEGPMIILGYGDVGRHVAKVLSESGIKPIVLDRKVLEDIPFVHIQGEATSEDLLNEAGIRDAAGIMILLNNDSDVIYCTLLAKNLNPYAFVVARANRVKSVEKIYKAGADYVACVPLVASHMLAKIIQEEEEELTLLYEDLELKLFKVGKKTSLNGKSLKDIDLPGRFGCSVAAMEKKGQAIAAIDQGIIVEEGDILALIGSQESIKTFSVEFDRRSIFARL